MQTTGQFHRDIGIALFGVPEHVLDNPASLDARDHMFNHDPNPGNETIMGFVLRRRNRLAPYRRYPTLLGVASKGSFGYLTAPVSLLPCS